MANHVDNFLVIDSKVPAAIEAFNKVFSLIEDHGASGLEYSHFLPSWDEEYPTRDYMEETIGAKWAYVEEVGDDYVVATSAWCSILPYVKQLGLFLSQFDPDISISCRYIDECYNFSGIIVYHKETIDYEEESKSWFVEKRSEELGIETDDWDEFEDDMFLDEYVITHLDEWGKGLKESIIECSLDWDS